MSSAKVSVILRTKALLEIKEPDPEDPALAEAQGKKLVLVANWHIVSGSTKIHHEIPGKNPTKNSTSRSNVSSRA